MLKELLTEYNIQIDDVRWYLSILFSKRLLEYKEDLSGLAEFIWSKKMETELYEMEENYLKKIEQEFKQYRIDESRIREILSEITFEKAKRFRYRKPFI